MDYFLYPMSKICKKSKQSYLFSYFHINILHTYSFDLAILKCKPQNQAVIPESVNNNHLLSQQINQQRADKFFS